jgi:hypothetical protein
MRRVVVWRLVGIGASALALVAAAACSTPATLTPAAGKGRTTTTTAPPLPSSLDVVPAANARNVSPANPVSAALANGELDNVVLTAASG